MTNDNLNDLFSLQTNEQQLQRQVAALRSMVIRLCQEVDALRATLADTGQLDQARFNHHCRNNLLRDHSSAGPYPWAAYSYYRFVVTEQEYLRTRLGLTQEEVAQFAEEVEHIQTLT